VYRALGPAPAQPDPRWDVLEKPTEHSAILDKIRVLSGTFGTFAKEQSDRAYFRFISGRPLMGASEISDRICASKNEIASAMAFGNNYLKKLNKK
jgi:hypothetical protein